MPRVDTLPDSLHEITARIQAACLRVGRAPNSVRLIAATKTIPASQLVPYLQSGLTDCGENYVQEAVGKISELGNQGLSPVHWHLIGALQTKKAAMAVAHFDLIHSLDRVSLADALDKAAAASGKIQPVLLQLNIGDEATKSGCPPTQLIELVKVCMSLPNLELCGLMCLPPYSPNPEASRRHFVRLRELRDELITADLATEAWHLSMGMSGDFEVAIEEGATLVRIGTALFGDRNRR